MKNALILIILSVIVRPVFGDDFGNVSAGQFFLTAVRQRILTSEQVESDAGNIQVDLGYFYENTNNPPELRLVAHAGGKDLVIWWASIVAPREVPIEFTYGVDRRNRSLGLCFYLGNLECLFYEIDASKALKFAKANAGRALGSVWISGEGATLLNYSTNDMRQDFRLYELLHIASSYYYSMKDLKLTVENNQWVISTVVSGLDNKPDVKVFLNCPVGSTGFAFLKKEVLTQEAEYNPANEIKWRIALGAVFLLVVVPTFFVVRKIGRQKTAAATKP
jgi:hypothetical protein